MTRPPIVRGQCNFCDRPVTTHDRAAFPITGWEAERTGGGANRIIGRRRLPDTEEGTQIAHADCAEHDAKYGAQGSLLD